MVTVLLVTQQVGGVLVMPKVMIQFSQMNSILAAENDVMVLLEKIVCRIQEVHYAFKVANTGEKCVAHPGDALPDCVALHFGGEVAFKCDSSC